MVKNHKSNFFKGVMFIMLFSLAATGYSNELDDGIYAEIETPRGKILLSLEYEKTPMTVMNFTGLAEGKIDGGQGIGKPFYDGLNFHRVLDNFMIQGGCPLGTGTGNPGYTFPDEFHPSLDHSAPGALSMANSGPGTNGSQFFITHVPTTWLDNKHTVFGKVIEGQNVVDAVKTGDKIKSVKIIRVGDKAKAFKNDKAAMDAIADKAVSSTKKTAAAKMKEDEAFIVKTWPEAKKTKSGLMYIVREEGKGTESPTIGNTVTTHYEGKLLNGTIFDSSYKRNQPLEFRIGEVIPGWNEALQDMKKGEKRTLIIPPNLAYGASGAGGVIPPNAYLIFEVELIDF